METNIIIATIAVLGTLAGSVVTALLTNMSQNRIYAREAEREKERERRQARRDLLSSRLSIVEEAADLIMFLIGVGMDKFADMHSYCDPDTLATKRQRIEEIYLQARTAAKAVSSEVLAKHFGEMVSAFWKTEASSEVFPEDYEAVSEAYGKVIEIVDEIKTNV